MLDHVHPAKVVSINRWSSYVGVVFICGSGLQDRFHLEHAYTSLCSEGVEPRYNVHSRDITSIVRESQHVRIHHAATYCENCLKDHSHVWPPVYRDYST